MNPTNDDQAPLGSGQGYVHLVLIVDESKVFPLPALAWFGLNLYLGLGAHRGEDHIVPLTPYDVKKTR